MNGLRHLPAPDPNARYPPDNCPGWSHKSECNPGGWVLATSIGLIVNSGLYFIFYCIAMLRVYFQLSQQSFVNFRAPNILFQIQVR